MKVKSIQLRDFFGNELHALCITPMGDRYYKICNDYEIIVRTSSNEYRYNICNGFVTNFRSGGLLVDSFVDQIGDSLPVQLSWLCHDAGYTPCASLGNKHPLGRKEADELLRAMLRFAGMSSFKASCVYNSVRLFGGSAYKEDDRLTKANSELFSFVKGKV